MAYRVVDRADAKDKIVQAVGVGATRTLACDYAGIDLDTLARWIKRDAELAERIKRAEGKAAIGWLAVIEKAATKQWQAAAWKLERRYPHDYGRTIQEQQQSGEVTIRVVRDD